MTPLFEYSQPVATLSLSSHRDRRQLLQAFWLIAIALLVFELWAQTSSLLINLGALCITAAVLLPNYLWCSGRVQGIPIFPFFALPFVWAYALPLVSNHPTVSAYAPEKQLFASLTIAGFLTLGTLVWYQFVKSTPPFPQTYRALNDQKGDAFFLSVLVIAILFSISNNAGWFFLSGGLYTAFRSAVLGLTALATFVLSYKLGTRALSKQKTTWFVSLLATYMVTNTVALLLIGAASSFMAATIAFIIGRKKIPFATILIMFVCLSLLHYGKAEMRAKYWANGLSVKPWEYPAWYSEWVGYTFSYADRYQQQPELEQKASFSERASVMQILLMAQDKSPSQIPFMYGKTYTILPQLIVPRILNPNKVASHEGTYLLNIHYKRQTRAQTQTTTIGWGLLAEAYANFGLLGCAGLAIVLGSLYGQATRWSINAPILSAQSLFAVLMITFAIQTEWSAGVYVAALSQAGVVLSSIVLILMKTYPVMVIPTLNYE